jgi:hypothetical protein
MAELQKFDNNSRNKIAYELTKLAIENNMLGASADGEDAAMRVIEFYQKINKDINEEV